MVVNTSFGVWSENWIAFCESCRRTFDRNLTRCPTDGKALMLVRDPRTALPDPMVGEVIDGEYVIERLIGQGGNGRVYLARQPSVKRLVAIKMLPPGHVGDQKRNDRFVVEGKAATRFTHANAVTVYDFRRSSEGFLYMVMEFVDGQSLRSILESRRLFTAAETVCVLDRVASALDTAHMSGVVHRDIKPENILIAGQDVTSFLVKVADFGLAKLLESSQDLTMDALLGTLPYMSPEQWGAQSRDGRKKIDGRTDIYALAATAFEMIGGRRPFKAENATEYMALHTSAACPLLEAGVRGVTHGFAAAVSRAMSKDRADRPATAGEFIAELRATLEHGYVPESDTQSILETVSLLSSASRLIKFSEIEFLKEWVVNLGRGVLLEMVLIPAGSFEMGSESGDRDERPVHLVTISKPFLIGKYEVTQGQWKLLMDDNPSIYKGDDELPVDQSSWADCQEFIKRLNAHVGMDYRLPTEAEWEFACRAGTTGDYSGVELEEVAWYEANSGGSTHPVGQKRPNEWGLYDMHGNVWEWCADWYDERLYSRGPCTDPPGPLVGSDRVFRGGGWNSQASNCRSANRQPGWPGSRLGFRLARTLSAAM